MLPLKPPNFKYKLFFFGSLPSTNVQFDLGSSFASSSLPNVASLSRSRSRSNARSSSLPSRFSTSESSSQLGNAHGLHVPCDPTNASTLSALGFAELGTFDATSFVELQGNLGVVSFIELQGTLGVANSTNFYSSSSRNAYRTQGPTYGEPTKKKNNVVEIKKVFKEEWATQFPWAKPMVDLTSKI
jgi:hypothetical protein